MEDVLYEKLCNCTKQEDLITSKKNNKHSSREKRSGWPCNNFSSDAWECTFCHLVEHCLPELLCYCYHHDMMFPFSMRMNPQCIEYYGNMLDRVFYNVVYLFGYSYFFEGHGGSCQPNPFAVENFHFELVVSPILVPKDGCSIQ
jgi:hypothetical protein